jgi:hypothetical protein
MFEHHFMDMRILSRIQVDYLLGILGSLKENSVERGAREVKAK